MRNRKLYYEIITAELYKVVQDMQKYFDNIVACIEKVVDIALEYINMSAGENRVLWRSSLESDLVELFV